MAAGVRQPAGAWIDIFFSLLVAPQATLRRLAAEAAQGWRGLAGALAAVVAASVVDGLVSAGTRFHWSLPFLVAFGVVGGLAGWLLIAGTIALPAAAFGAERRKIRASFVTSGWALLPWIFMAPLFAYRAAIGPAAIPLSLVPFVWVVCLEWIAIQEAYELSGWQTLFLFIFLPQAVLVSAIWWAAQVIGCGINLLAG